MDIIDVDRIEARPLDKSTQNLCRQLDRVHSGQTAISLSDRGSYGFDYHGVSQLDSPRWGRPHVRPANP